MDIKLEPTYTAEDIAAVLRESEGQTAGGGYGTGHAEGKHALLAAGQGHKGNTIRHASRIALGHVAGYGAGVVGLFHSRQPEAIAFALNRNSGQASLRYLATIAECYAVFAKLDISAGAFNMKCFYPDDIPTDLPDGVFIPDRASLRNLNPENPNTAWDDPLLLVPAIGVAGGLWMKLMKVGGRRLHIRTAFPTFQVPAPETARLDRTDIGSQTVELPV